VLRIRISGAPGTRKICQRYGSGSDSGSRSFHQAKIVRKTLIPTVSWLLYDLLSLKNDVNVPSKSRAGVGSGSVSQRYGSADPYKNVTDPQHCHHLGLSNGTVQSYLSLTATKNDGRQDTSPRQHCQARASIVWGAGQPHCWLAQPGQSPARAGWTGCNKKRDRKEKEVTGHSGSGSEFYI
jgi:hypothetical protein